MYETSHAPLIKSITAQNTGRNHKNNGIEHSKTVDAKLTYKNLNEINSVYYTGQQNFGF